MSRPTLPPRPPSNNSPPRQPIVGADRAPSPVPLPVSPLSSPSQPLPPSFSLPDYYDFPPFFTIQPNANTRAKQLQLWCDLIVGFARSITDNQLPPPLLESFVAPLQPGVRASPAARCVTLSSSGRSNTSFLFANARINRSLDSVGITTVFESLASIQHAVWLGGSRSTLLVSARSLDDWASEIDTWASDLGLSTSISTLYEIQSGAASHGTAHFGLHTEMLCAALAKLQARGRCQLIPGDTALETGIKFRGS